MTPWAAGLPRRRDVTALSGVTVPERRLYRISGNARLLRRRSPDPRLSRISGRSALLQASRSQNPTSLRVRARAAFSGAALPETGLPREASGGRPSADLASLQRAGGRGMSGRTADVVVIGGAVMGASAAYWLTRMQPGLRVIVVERDPTYARASTALSVASIRMQFTTPVNVAISRFGIGFIRDFRESLGQGGGDPVAGPDRERLSLPRLDGRGRLGAGRGGRHAAQPRRRDRDADARSARRALPPGSRRGISWQAHSGRATRAGSTIWDC